MRRFNRVVRSAIALAAYVAIGAGAATLVPVAPRPGPDGDESLAPDGVLGGRIMRTLGSDSSGRWDVVEPNNVPARMRGSAPDPDGGLRWTVRTYESLLGQTCAQAGRTAGGRFGRAGKHGELVPLPLEPAGACANLRDAPLSVALDIYTKWSGQGPRMVVFGVAGPLVESIALVTADGSSSEVALDDGAYVVARRGNGLAGAQLEITMRDGSVLTRQLTS